MQKSSTHVSIKAFNNFQGFFKLKEPCFDVYEHKSCTKRLWDVFRPSFLAPANNNYETKMYLFTWTSKDRAEQIHQCGGRLPPDTTFNTSCKTEVFVHGYSDGLCRTAWMREMKEQLFQRRDCHNVMLVDWTWGNLIDIATSVINAKGVGQQIAFALKQISRQVNYNTSNFHITANSYGVIVASYCGKSMQDPDYRLGRLTSLDFALPPFLYASEEERLNPSDALFVDAIHTNGGDCFPYNIGDPRQLGHVDMYVNDGVHQYSCNPYAYESFLKLDVFYATASVIYPALCYHVQSIQYYKVSILAGMDNTYLIGALCNNYEEFLNGKCNKSCEIPGTCAPLGLDLPDFIDTTERKIYHVLTSKTCPYHNHTGFSGLPLKPIR